MPARFASTARLSNIIQMIALARQNGILRVMRGQGPTRELGQIRFVAGDAVTALLGQVTGQAALNVLINWGECAYAFDETLQTDTLGSDGGAGVSSPPPEIFGGSWPPYGYARSSPNEAVPLSSSSLSGQGGQASFPRVPAQSGYPTVAGGWPNGAPGDARGVPTQGASMTSPMTSAPSGATTPALSPLPQHLLASVPHRTVISEAIDQLPLDRRERMVLLLVDGRRDMADLTRLTRRSQEELYAVLRHLEMLGLVEFH